MDTRVLNSKIELIQWLSTLEDEAIIEKLLQFRNKEVQDWWNSIADEEKQSVEKGVAEADNEELTPHATARALYEKWL